MPRHISYLRVSTSNQDLESQRYGVLRFAQSKGWIVSEFIEEKISSGVPYQERLLGTLINQLQTGDTIIVPELSRLGRSTLEVLTIMNKVIEKECVVAVVKGGIELRDDLSSKILTFCLGLIADIEKDLIKARTKEALAKLKSEGRVLGRPKGSRSKSKLDQHEQLIVDYLSKGVSKTSLCRVLGCSVGCLQNFIRSRAISTSGQL